MVATSSKAKKLTVAKAANPLPLIPMKFLKALFEGFTSEAKKTCGNCDNCNCKAKPSFYDRYCEENPWADQCKIYED